jgi:hypothetical protein
MANRIQHFDYRKPVRKGDSPRKKFPVVRIPVRERDTIRIAEADGSSDPFGVCVPDDPIDSLIEIRDRKRDSPD